MVREQGFADFIVGVGASSTSSPAVEVQDVPLSELRSVPPCETRYVTVVERAGTYTQRTEL